MNLDLTKSSQAEESQCCCWMADNKRVFPVHVPPQTGLIGQISVAVCDDWSRNLHLKKVDDLMSRPLKQKCNDVFILDHTRELKLNTAAHSFTSRKVANVIFLSTRRLKATDYAENCGSQVRPKYFYIFYKQPSTILYNVITTDYIMLKFKYHSLNYWNINIYLNLFGLSFPFWKLWFLPLLKLSQIQISSC